MKSLLAAETSELLSVWKCINASRIVAVTGVHQNEIVLQRVTGVDRYNHCKNILDVEFIVWLMLFVRCLSFYVSQVFLGQVSCVSVTSIHWTKVAKKISEK